MLTSIVIHVNYGAEIHISKREHIMPHMSLTLIDVTIVALSLTLFQMTRNMSLFGLVNLNVQMHAPA